LQLYRDSTPIGQAVQAEASATNENVPYCLSVIDSPGAGTYVYKLEATSVNGSNFQFGEAAGPVISVVELTGAGTSGSSGTSGASISVPGLNNELLTSDGSGGLVAETDLTFDGSILRSPYLYSTNSVGDEGGEINLAVPQNTTLSTGIVVDSFQDRVRIFEGGGSARGVSIDLSKTPNGVGGELFWKTSGFLDAGIFLSMDNLKVTVTTSGNRGLSVAAVSTSFTANVAGWYIGGGGGNGSMVNNQSWTTTPTTSLFGWNFTAEGEVSTYSIVDKTNNRMYRVTLMIGSAYLNNFLSIERLY
jgi:hypothetical protein